MQLQYDQKAVIFYFGGFIHARRGLMALGTKKRRHKASVLRFQFRLFFLRYSHAAVIPTPASSTGTHQNMAMGSPLPSMFIP